jgi:sec-independent protein translocase protein TatA
VFRQIGAPEIILILAVVVLLFGAKKLPELARGSGRALRIFKAETKGLMTDDETEDPASPRPITSRDAAAPQTSATQSPTNESTATEGERRPDAAG